MTECLVPPHAVERYAQIHEDAGQIVFIRKSLIRIDQTLDLELILPQSLRFLRNGVLPTHHICAGLS